MLLIRSKFIGVSIFTKREVHACPSGTFDQFGTISSIVITMSELFTLKSESSVRLAFFKSSISYIRSPSSELTCSLKIIFDGIYVIFQPGFKLISYKVIFTCKSLLLTGYKNDD